MMSVVREVNVEGRVIKFEFQKFAKQANGSVMVTSGGTQVLVTACAASKPSPGVDFFPLGVDYIEKFYATGRIPGGYRKRESRPGDQEALTARVIDRPETVSPDPPTARPPAPVRRPRCAETGSWTRRTPRRSGCASRRARGPSLRSRSAQASPPRPDTSASQRTL